MESITFVYSLATQQEKRTEALKNKEQNQLDKYRALIQKQMEKEEAFLSYKKIEFLSRQEVKLGGKRRSLSARVRMGDYIPDITTKAQPKEMAYKIGLLGSRTETRNLTPFIYRQRTHLGMEVAYSKPKSTNTRPGEGRKSRLTTMTGSNSVVVNSQRITRRKEKVST